MSEKAKKTEITEYNPLKNKKVTIALIKRIHSSLYRDIDEATLATGGSKSFSLPVNSKTGRFIDPLTHDERLFLENITGLNLSIHEKKDNFWTTKSAMVILRKVGRKTESANLILDLNDPYQYILYKIALVNPRVAPNWSDRYENKQFEFVIIDGEVQLEEEYNYTDIEDDVNEYLLKIKNSKRKLFDFIRMYGVKNLSAHVKYSNTAKWMYNELRKAFRRPAEVKKMHALVKLGSKDLSSKVFLEDCVTSGLIDYNGSNYSLVGGAKIGNTDIDAIAWLYDKKNDSVKKKFEQAIEDFYSTNK